jgi:hypothetical protein
MEDLKLLLSKRKYNPAYIPPEDTIIFKIEDKNILSYQNFSILSGLPKTCKSTLISAIISSAISNKSIFDMSVKLPIERPNLAYFDTESSDYDFYRQIERIKTFSQKQIPENLFLYQVREDSPGTIRKLIEHNLKEDNKISFIIIDGLLDLCLNYNDEKETRLLVNWLKKITKVYNVGILSVLHLGKKDEQTLGHLGSNTDRWAQSTLKVTKDKEKGVYILEPKFLRSAEDFNPIIIKNINGKWEQMYNEQKPEYKTDKLTHLEKTAIIFQAIKKPLSYKELVENLQAVTGRGANYCKQLIKELIFDNLIEKTEKGYADKNFF